MLVDEIAISISSGAGGSGKVSFGKGTKAGPDGGNGGKGGDVYFVGTDDIYALNKFTRQDSWAAENGQDGGNNLKSGRNGQDLEIEVPVGTEIISQKTHQLVAQIDEKGQRILICKGAVGGLGNYEYRSSTNTTPKYAQWGEKGKQLHLRLVLKLIANVGLIGLPNSGKSSLLNELTNSKAKTGNYNFTTLSPNLGVFEDLVIADIPGLIEGAAEGKGLGISFLKHIEKVNVLVHCLSVESTNPKKDYQVIRKELERYNPALLTKPELLLVTKSDLTDNENLNKIAKQFKTHKPLAVSVHDWESLNALQVAIRRMIKDD